MAVGSTSEDTLPDMEAVYDAIAKAWERTRSGAWPAVTSFLGRLPRGTMVADVGVGSGRYLAVPESRGLRVVGVDFSREQLALARRFASKQVALVRGDVRALPMATGRFGAALHIAVVHHLAFRAQRVDALRELRRVLVPGASALMSAWGDHAEVFRGAKPFGRGPRDFLVPFKEKLDRPAERFFHAYVDGELGSEAREAGFQKAREWTEQENQFVEVVR